jgi:hypothetical protein
MARSPSNLLAGIVGASSALAGLVVAAPCDGRGCLACARCAGVGAAALLAALCYRSCHTTAQPAHSSTVVTPDKIPDLPEP